MKEIDSSLKKKIGRIFRNKFGIRADELETPGMPKSRGAIKKAFARAYGAGTANDIAFHLCDWNSDAAFLVALHLFPEKFTPAEIREGIIQLIVHAPNHIAAAAKLSGHPVHDVWEIGALEPDEE